MKRLALLLIGLLIGAAAFAGQVTITWTAPTKNTDGTTLTDLAKYNVYRGSSASSLSLLTSVTAPATTYTDTAAPVGVVFYSVSAVNSAGIESTGNPVGSKTVAPPQPNPPSGLTLAVVIGVNVSPVFSIAANNTRGATVLGFVAPGAACSGPALFSYRGAAYRRVEPTAVKWWATQPTADAAAACG